VWQLALIRLGLPPLRNTFTRGGGRVATAIVRALATQVIVLSCTTKCSLHACQLGV
jgi:hypothetical protein